MSSNRTIYVPEPQWRAWQAEARRLGATSNETVSVSEYIRRAVEAYAHFVRAAQGAPSKAVAALQ